MRKRPYIPVYQPWSVTFRVDREGLIWRFFREWNNLILNVTNDLAASAGVSKYEIAYKNTYLADMEVSVFTTEGVPAITATMIEAFPYILSPVRLDWAELNSYIRCRVDFAFTDWVETNSSDNKNLLLT